MVDKTDRKIALALGGGGARGFAHIGILQVLRAAGIACDAVAGTSIGALVGAVYASGTLDALAAAAKAIRVRDIPLLLSPSWSLSGMFSGKNVLEQLSQFVKAERIEELPLPFAAISVDIHASELVTFTRGDIKQAIRASIAIPGLFTPVADGQRLLVDGAVIEPVPVEAARTLGGEFVIAVDLFSERAVPRLPPPPTTQSSEREPGAWEIALAYLMKLRRRLPLMAGHPPDTNANGALRSVLSMLEVIEMTLMVSQQHLTALRLRQHPPDFVLKPPVGEIGILDFHCGEMGIAIGRQTAEEALPQLQALLADKRQEIRHRREVNGP